ncbi:unnamed protein product [Amoebophrya sp. A25]|nr:unnamed protein product [Amoebophrya sp. A25]|eukprot:GSA25T00003577001.1
MSFVSTPRTLARQRWNAPRLAAEVRASVDKTDITADEYGQLFGDQKHFQNVEYLEFEPDIYRKRFRIPCKDFFRDLLNPFYLVNRRYPLRFPVLFLKLHQSDFFKYFLAIFTLISLPLDTTWTLLEKAWWEGRVATFLPEILDEIAAVGPPHVKTDIEEGIALETSVDWWHLYRPGVTEIAWEPLIWLFLKQFCAIYSVHWLCKFSLVYPGQGDDETTDEDDDDDEQGQREAFFRDYNYSTSYNRNFKSTSRGRGTSSRERGRGSNNSLQRLRSSSEQSESRVPEAEDVELQERRTTVENAQIYFYRETPEDQGVDYDNDEDDRQNLRPPTRPRTTSNEQIGGSESSSSRRQSQTVPLLASVESMVVSSRSRSSRSSEQNDAVVQSNETFAGPDDAEVVDDPAPLPGQPVGEPAPPEPSTQPNAHTRTQAQGQRGRSVASPFGLIGLLFGVPDRHREIEGFANHGELNVFERIQRSRWARRVALFLGIGDPMVIVPELFLFWLLGLAYLYTMTAFCVYRMAALHWTVGVLRILIYLLSAYHWWLTRVLFIAMFLRGAVPRRDGVAPKVVLVLSILSWFTECQFLRTILVIDFRDRNMVLPALLFYPWLLAFIGCGYNALLLLACYLSLRRRNYRQEEDITTAGAMTLGRRSENLTTAGAMTLGRRSSHQHEDDMYQYNGNGDDVLPRRTSSRGSSSSFRTPGRTSRQEEVGKIGYDRRRSSRTSRFPRNTAKLQLPPGATVGQTRLELTFRRKYFPTLLAQLSVVSIGVLAGMTLLLMYSKMYRVAADPSAPSFGFGQGYEIGLSFCLRGTLAVFLIVISARVESISGLGDDNIFRGGAEDKKQVAEGRNDEEHLDYLWSGTDSIITLPAVPRPRPERPRSEGEAAASEPQQGNEIEKQESTSQQGDHLVHLRGQQSEQASARRRKFEAARMKAGEERRQRIGEKFESLRDGPRRELNFVDTEEDDQDEEEESPNDEDGLSSGSEDSRNVVMRGATSPSLEPDMVLAVVIFVLTFLSRFFFELLPALLSGPTDAGMLILKHVISLALYVGVFLFTVRVLDRPGPKQRQPVIWYLLALAFFAILFSDSFRRNACVEVESALAVLDSANNFLDKSTNGGGRPGIPGPTQQQQQQPQGGNAGGGSEEQPASNGGDEASSPAQSQPQEGTSPVVSSGLDNPFLVAATMATQQKGGQEKTNPFQVDIFQRGARARGRVLLGRESSTIALTAQQLPRSGGEDPLRQGQQNQQVVEGQVEAQEGEPRLRAQDSQIIDSLSPRTTSSKQGPPQGTTLEQGGLGYESRHRGLQAELFPLNTTSSRGHRGLQVGGGGGPSSPNQPPQGPQGPAAQPPGAPGAQPAEGGASPGSQPPGAPGAQPAEGGGAPGALQPPGAQPAEGGASPGAQPPGAQPAEGGGAPGAQPPGAQPPGSQPAEGGASPGAQQPPATVRTVLDEVPPLVSIGGRRPLYVARFVRCCDYPGLHFVPNFFPPAAQAVCEGWGQRTQQTSQALAKRLMGYQDVAELHTRKKQVAAAFASKVREAEAADADSIIAQYQDQVRELMEAGITPELQDLLQGGDIAPGPRFLELFLFLIAFLLVSKKLLPDKRR